MQLLVRVFTLFSSLAKQASSLQSSNNGSAYCQDQAAAVDFPGLPSSLQCRNGQRMHHLSSEHSISYSDGNLDHVRQTASHPDPANETEPQKHDPHYLPSGYYDALGNPISEKEYFYQADYEQKHGIPYARDREREKADTRKPLSLQAHPEIDCNGDVVARVVESGICYSVQGSSIYVNSLPSDCAVVSFEDERCTEDPFEMIPILSDASGCYTTDAFSSVRVDCRPLPA